MESEPCVIKCFDENEIKASEMLKSLSNWKWPVNKNELFYKLEVLYPTKHLSKRRLFTVPKLADS